MSASNSLKLKLAVPVMLLAAGTAAYLHEGGDISSVFGIAAVQSSGVAADDAIADLITPAGITLQPLGKAQGYDLGKESAAFLARERIAYADEKGMTLYTYKRDPVGKSTCVDTECRASWRPALAAGNERTFAGWSIITRDDGAKQWAYQGKPLYTYVKDVDPGSVAGDSPARFGAPRKNGAGEIVGGGVRGSLIEEGSKGNESPQDWQVALAYPVTETQLPAGISVREVPDATALVLVDHTQHTLYYHTGGEDGKSDDGWKPAAAPQLSGALAEFDFVMRRDGIRQWTYKGKPLYVYQYDLEPGVANGIGNGWQAAAVKRYYLPDNVTLHDTPGQGKVLATGDGMTLYRRDGYIFQSGGGHSLRRGQPARPAVGRDIGIDVRCDATCRKQWRPFPAPADARAQGQWTVLTHPDGVKQWAYQGYGLWTYAGDRQPGDLNGNDTWDYMYFAGRPDARADTDASRQQLAEIGTPMDGAPGLYWFIAVP